MRRHLDLNAAAQHDRRHRRQIDQFTQYLTGFAQRSGFEVSAEYEQECDRSGFPNLANCQRTDGGDGYQ